MKIPREWLWATVLLYILSFNMGCSENSDSEPANKGDDASGKAIGGTQATGEGGSEAVDGATAAKTEPFLWGAGVGVTDLEAATEFYTKFMDMEVDSEVTREDRYETILWAKAADRGSRVVLMKFKDGRNTQKITGKFVYAVADVKTLYASLTSAGYASILAPITFSGVTVSQVTGPEGFIIELVQTETANSFLISLGIGVSDLSASETFYANAIGMETTDQYALGTLNEKVMEYPAKGGAAIVLMNYTSGNYTYKDNPVKHVHHVPDAAALLEKITQGGGSIVKAVGKLSELGDKTGAIAKDPDGYLIEIIQQ
jgi:predicted enzyme related to lactoylglutathione lyase